MSENVTNSKGRITHRSWESSWLGVMGILLIALEDMLVRLKPARSSPKAKVRATKHSGGHRL